MKEAHLLVLEPWLRGRLQVCQTFRGYKGALREHKLGEIIFVLSFCLTTAHQHPSEMTLYSQQEP